MRCVRMVAVLAAAAALMAAGQPPIFVVTTLPFDALTQCVRAKWTGTGRITPINTAAGAMYDVAFPAIDNSGRVSESHAIFSVEDRGTERRVSASAAAPTDAPLVRQMLDQTMTACAPAAGRR